MRLIDADELKKMFMHAEDAEYAKWSLNGVISEIDDMPTVCDIPPFINKLCVSSGVCREDKMKVLGQIRAEIERATIEMDYDTAKEALAVIDNYTKGDTE